jgi:Rab proteins geranylgeranyltransferase component A
MRNGFSRIFFVHRSSTYNVITMATTTCDSIDIDKEAKCSSPNDESSSTKDEEGLSVHYDVVICGTGLVQALVAASCARAGKSVLHLDGADYYGELDAVWSLPYVIQQQQQQNQQKKKNEDTNRDPGEGLSGGKTSQHSAESQSESAPPTTKEASSAGSPSQEEQVDETIVSLDSRGGYASLQFHSMKSLSRAEDYYPLRVGMRVSTPYGLGRIESFEGHGNDGNARRGSVAVQLDANAGGGGGMNASATTLYSGIVVVADKSDSTTNAELTLESLKPSDLVVHKVVPLAALQAQEILEGRSRSFALDVTPSLLYCGGRSIQALLDSQVSDYLEFKALNGLLWYRPPPAATASDDANPKLLKVPCSKADVFNSELLTPMEKRRLMKFLQLAMDYAVMHEDDPSNDAGGASDDPDTDDQQPSSSSSSIAAAKVQSLNERTLNQGRSLSRPQNKGVATNDLQVLQDCIQQNMSFDAYLKSKANLSDNLSSIVLHALSLILSEQRPTEEDGTAHSTPLGVGMACLCRHMASLGKFGATAFLYPMYGSGELSQAFCRSAAVYGATYLLRRPVDGVVVCDNRVTSVILSERGDHQDDDTETLSAPCASTKRIRCDHVVLPQQSISSSVTATTRFVLRRISILRGKCIGGDNNPGAQQQQLVVFPPASIHEQHLYPIHALLLDEHVSVAPHVNCGCTLVHLTTVASSTSHIDELLSDALRSLMKAAGCGEECQDIFHLSFSYVLDADIAPPASPPNGWHFIPRSHVGVGNEAAFQRAHDIFREICPADAYMKVAKKVSEGAMFQRRDDEDDDSQRILNLAMETIGTASESAVTDMLQEDEGGSAQEE